MTNDDGRKPEGAPERSPKACAGGPSDVEGNGPKCFSVSWHRWAFPSVYDRCHSRSWGDVIAITKTANAAGDLRCLPSQMLMFDKPHCNER